MNFPKTITRILLFLLTVCLLGCSNSNGSVEIPKNNNGYVFSELLGIEQDRVLSGLYQEGEDPQFYSEIEYLGSKVRSYVMPETKDGLEFESSMLFINYPIPETFILSGYDEKLYLDHWPTKNEAASIQSMFDDLINSYGAPTQKNCIFDDDLLFDEYKISKYGMWKDGLVSFSIDYDPVTKETIIWIHNYDSSFYSDNFAAYAGRKES